MPSPKSKKKRPADHQPKTSRYGASWRTPLTDLDLPSGDLCQVKRPGVQGLIKAGVLHSLDSLTSIVQTETIPKASGKPIPDDKSVENLVNDPEKFGEMMEVVDKIVVHVVTQPKVVSHLTPELDEEGNTSLDPKTGVHKMRELTDQEKLEQKTEWESEHPDQVLVFVDWIDAMDKMYIMNFAVGGSANLQEFRQATEAPVGGLPAGEATPSETE